MSRLNILCYDHQNMVAARLTKTSAFGAEMALLCDSPDPVFALNSTIILEILDESSGDSMRSTARLARATLENRTWIFILRWAGVPAIISKTI